KMTRDFFLLSFSVAPTVIAEDATSRELRRIPDALRSTFLLYVSELFSEAFARDINRHPLQQETQIILGRLDEEVHRLEYETFIESRGRDSSKDEELLSLDNIHAFVQQKFWADELVQTWMSLTLADELTWAEGEKVCRGFEKIMPGDLMPSLHLLYKFYKRIPPETYDAWYGRLIDGYRGARTQKLRDHFLRLAAVTAPRLSKAESGRKSLRKLTVLFAEDLKKPDVTLAMRRSLNLALSTIHFCLGEYDETIRHGMDADSEVSLMLATGSLAYQRRFLEAGRVIKMWKTMALLNPEPKPQSLKIMTVFDTLIHRQLSPPKKEE
ncbi:MAG: hypothetical protein AAF492_19570, partial [Verrucomicrobiota bacterium]